MEEKERYEIHIYDDICVDLYDNGVLDKSINDTYKLEELLNQQYKENQQLKQQLDEKEKELSEYVKIVDDLHKQLSDKCDFCNKTKDQDKISFAVEQLEKVKNYMITDEKDMFGANYLINSVYVLEFIDNQIKQLKEMK